MTELTNAQRARLEKARQRHEAAQGRKPAQPQGFVLNREAYLERLKEAMSQSEDQVKDLRTRILEDSLKEWSDRVGPRWANAHTDNPAVQDRLDRMKSGEGTHKTSLLAIGKLGVGKTWTAYAYAGEMIRSGILTSPQIFIANEASIAAVTNAGFNSSARLNEILNPKHKLFIFDDIGQANYSNAGARQGIWHAILDYIYSHRLAMVLTTNLSVRAPENVRGVNGEVVSKSELNLWLGDAAYSRLQILIGGKDGIVVPGDKNMRLEVFKDWEEEYVEKKQ